MNDDEIRPRTKSERMALLAGFAMCLELVVEHGTKAAREQFQVMAEAEEELHD